MKKVQVTRRRYNFIGENNNSMKQKAQFPPKTIIIYSVGLLGGSIGIGLKESGYTGKIIGISSLKNIEKALALGCIDEGYPYDQLGSVIQQCDIIFLCSPITVICDTLHRLADCELPQDLIITDVGSTKRTIAQTAQETLPPHVHFIGGHPMAGSEKSGPAASDPYLFQNAIYVLTPLTEKPTTLDKQFADFLKRYLGSRDIFLKPDEHDTIAATVSHIPHLLAVALVNLAGKIENQTPGTIRLAAGGFRDLTRIASAPFKMWDDIFLTNKETIAPLLDECIDALQTMKKDLTEDNLETCFIDAVETRGKIPVHNKGFITPLFEILVIAKDQPGIISSISSTLSAHDINIKDIEVIKIREGEGGTIKLAFETGFIAHNAIAILNKKGFSAWERK